MEEVGVDLCRCRGEGETCAEGECVGGAVWDSGLVVGHFWSRIQLKRRRGKFGNDLNI